MPDSITLAACAGLVLWLTILLLPWRPWSTRERLEVPRAAHDAAPAPGRITVLIPARDEAEVIATTLAALAAQDEPLDIVLIDDQSSDGTADIARAAGLPRLRVISGTPLPPGWSGKLWALEQGLAHADTELVLLLDADIALAPGALAALRRRMADPSVALVSVMAELRMQSFWERLLLPAFVYYFKLLYPFGLSNSRFPWVAAAAGGCVLLRRSALEEIGGFRALRGEIIDDCSLARQVKRQGHRTWIGLSRDVKSLRSYSTLKPIWDMVARTAYTQLRYSFGLLLLCTGLLLLAYAAPVAGLFAGSPAGRGAGAAALATMAVTYLPTLRYYGRSPVWALALPAVGVLFLAMTWTSALRYWRGERSRWKGRSYDRRAGADGLNDEEGFHPIKKRRG